MIPYLYLIGVGTSVCIWVVVPIVEVVKNRTWSRESLPRVAWDEPVRKTTKDKFNENEVY